MLNSSLKVIISVLLICLSGFLFSQSFDQNNLELWISPESESYINEQNEFVIESLVNNHLLIQDDINSQPSISESEPKLNDFSGISFDGINDQLYSEISLTDSFSITAFFKNSGAGQRFLYDTPSRMLLMCQSPSTIALGPLYISTPVLDQFLLITIVSDGTTSTIYNNGVEVISGLNNRNINGLFKVGSSINNDRFFLGRLYELLIFSQAIDNSKRVSIEEYIRLNYSPSVNLGDDLYLIPECPISLTSGDRFFTYEWRKINQSNDIIGTSPTLDVIEPGVYVLKATTLFGTSSDTLEVFELDSSIFQAYSICSESSVSLSLPYNEDNFNYIWSTNDLEGSNVEITESGVYSVYIEDQNGCSYTSPEFNVVDINEVIILPENIDLCYGNNISVDVPTDLEFEFIWSTTDISHSIIPETSGTYWIEAENAIGCIGRDTVDVTIIGVAPEVEFSFEGHCQNDEVLFNDNTVPADGTITGQTWEINGETYNGAEIAVLFQEAGEFNVNLTVSQDNGCDGTGSQTVTIMPQPVMDFTSPLVCSGTEVFFEDLSSIPTGSIVQRDWLFGNGTADSGVLGSTVFENPGNSNVQLINTSDAGCSDTLMRNVIVYGSPLPDFTWSPTCFGEPTLFEENVDISESGPVYWNWQFGDGFYSNFESTTHTYSQPGEYEVTLLATATALNGNGCQAAITKTITIHEPPLAEILLEAACLNEESVFTDLSVQYNTDPVINRQWTVAGQPAGTDSLQLYTFTEAGLYEVELQIETLSGCEASAGNSIEIFPLPVADFNLDVPLQGPPISLFPQNNSEDAVSWFWDFGNGESSTEFEPEIIYSDTGTYNIALQAFNEQGCHSTISETVVVFIPVFDIAVLGMEYSYENERLVLDAHLANYGNVNIEEFRMQVEVGSDINIAEQAYFTIPAGETGIYRLNPDFYFNPDSNHPYACLSLSNPGGEQDEDLSNNRLCIGINADEFYFIPPYPNPATNKINMGIVSPREGSGLISIYDTGGRLAGEFQQHFPKGYAQIEMDIKFLKNGLYVIVVEIGNEKYRGKVVVQSSKL